ncbi:MAG: ABC transporter substrate-binding protein, partial [Rhodospirillales bacterium]|nr:ABC transporter substrate-binding protein [Rhodospirillales bacterium]
MKYVSAGEIGSPEVAEQLGDDMPDGIWGNSYDVFYYPNTAEHKAYVEALKKKTGKQHPSSWPITGYIGMQFLAEAVKKAGGTDADASIKALEGMRSIRRSVRRRFGPPITRPI